MPVGVFMGTDVQVLDAAGKAETVSVEVKNQSAGLNRYSPLFSQQHSYENVYGFEPDAKAESVSVITEFCIRIFDVTGSFILLLLTSPLFLLSAVLVKATSRGPVIYKQKRVGKAGSIFTLYKFRTMIDGAEEQTGPIWAQRDDQRVTLVGKFLRRSRLDELPQLINVFRGNMSLVGPRPERPYFVNRHNALQGVRLSVKPGLTGLAQVRAFYDLKPEHKVKYDSLYIQKRSLQLNFYILLQTIPVIFLKRGW
jgi:lipopolysaccharide/colanic/teichoic acid biosynthesis glycosyltransferase